MSMNDEYQPINCDDYDNLELACQHHLVLTLKMRSGEVVEAKANDLLMRKKVEYLVVEANGEQRDLRLDHIESFSHPEIGTVVVSAE
ncbi:MULTISPECIES: Rho-binding antiterminator [Rahnella]|jgi:Rho-binding antiterminator|uniref:Transcriptional antiterminator, Rof n=1 Tax=Rahnella sp. (strain Y9602) TaxID=2703885 RepID=A0A0H3F6I4_RAHSY|nr:MULTISPECIES: Rho-binding antiterminator [Rahnella]AFE57090.1 Rho-binding antiterminator [Rahnella aquatilis HX2]AZP41099.1 Rho-binding antiterminator [Rahnella aquatilis]ADW72509.1 transcriptional antiterminator, Rof [Rahnella aceris]AZP45440.1 Rho-binding antiterminator [Rahnella aquatilis]MBU9839671.1 Rho-binding antiterminator [Rahnella aceris]